MSTRIKLYFKKLPDIELIDWGIFMIRLFCDVRFRFQDRFSDPYPAIVDTGAPVSIVPYHIWSRTDVRKLGRTKLKGFAPKEECSLPVTVGVISCILTDTSGKEKRVSFRAYLADTDEVPLILGFQDLLGKAAVRFEYRGDKAWLEI